MLLATGPVRGCTAYDAASKAERGQLIRDPQFVDEFKRRGPFRHAPSKQGKETATQARLALFGWLEGYMEAFRLATAYTRPEWIGNLTGLHLTKIVAELKDYCTTHPDWLLLLAAGRVSMQIAQDSTGRYK
jgi:hypothetical protein